MPLPCGNVSFIQIVQQEIDNILFQDLKTKYGVEYIYLNQDIWNVISSLICSQLSVESGKNYTEKYKFNNIMEESKGNIGDNVTRPTRTFRVL